jgi:hypothetical protein
LVALWLAGLRAVSADDGTAHNGPHNVPGVIQAVDFNDGGPFVAYYATTPGNQGGYSGYRPDTDVDIGNGPGGPYVISSRSSGNIVDEWLKYSIEVSQAGWYSVDYFARVIAPADSIDLNTLIDDRPLGYTTAVPVQDEFAPVRSQRVFFLGAGRHTLGVFFRTEAIALDRLEISLADAPLSLTPRIVPIAGPSAEVVVADAVVTDAPFLADPTGKQDSTQAFAGALAAVAAYGGGTVFAPAGIYRIDGTLFIPESTTLRGADPTDRSDPNRIGTLLLASFGEGDETAASFITLDLMACVRDLSVWYPSQGFTNDTVRPYPFTVFVREGGGNALNLRLYNSYDGIAIRIGDGTLAADIVGTALHIGLTSGDGAEYEWLCNVRFDNDTWKSAPRTLITNAPASDEDRLALDTYTSTHLVGAQIGLNTYGMYGLRVRDALQGMLVKKLPGDSGGFFSVISHIDAEIEDVDGYLAPDSGLHFLNTDNVPGVESLSYDFVGFRGPASATNFTNVKNQPFNAAGDGLADDTAAIQAALDQMGQLGGGTVYLPQGQYRVTRLTVPTGVELRGPLGGESHGFFAACTLLGYEGKGTAAPASDPALLTLSSHSGIRGFDIAYPEQGYGSSAAPVLAYPFTIRGTGPGVWVENISVENAYNLIDFASFQCDDHFVSGVEAAVLNTGILVGGGSKRGRLERVLITYGIYGGRQPRLGTPMTHGIGAISAYVLENAVPFVFGSCSEETTFGLDSFDVKIGWRMLADGGGCTDSTFWLPSSDTSSQTGYLFEGGDNLRFVGAEAGSSAGTSFVSSASFSGSVEIYGTMSWGNVRNRALSGGVFHFHNEASLTSGKTATASSTAFADETPASAVDGSEFTKWVSATDATSWLMVDLDQPAEIDRWVVRHAGIDGESDDLNASAFALQVSDDGVTFSAADSVTDNANRVTDRPAAARGRFVRLLVTRGTQAGGDGRARVVEFEAHGKEGWQFTNDAEGWAPLSDISAFAAGDGKLAITSSGGQPTIASPDNLNIPTSTFAKLKVRMRNSGAQTSTILAFTTEADPTFSAAKTVTIAPVVSSPEYVDYVFDLSSNAAWTGALQRLRLTPIQSTGDVSIDSIALEEYPHNRTPVPPQSPPRTPRTVSRQP